MGVGFVGFTAEEFWPHLGVVFESAAHVESFLEDLQFFPRILTLIS